MLSTYCAVLVRLQLFLVAAEQFDGHQKVFGSNARTLVRCHWITHLLYNSAKCSALHDIVFCYLVG